MNDPDAGSESYVQSVAALDAADDGMRRALRLLAQQRQLVPGPASRPSTQSTLSSATLSGGSRDSSPVTSCPDISVSGTLVRKRLENSSSTNDSHFAASGTRAGAPAAAAARHAADMAHVARASWPDSHYEHERAHVSSEPTSAWRSMVATASAAGSGAKSAPLSRVHRDVPPVTSLSQGANPGNVLAAARADSVPLQAIPERSTYSRDAGESSHEGGYVGVDAGFVSIKEFEELYAVHTSLRHELAMHGLDVRGGLVGGWSVRVSSLQALLTLISASCEEGSSDASRVDAAITALSMPHSQLSQAGSSHMGSASARANALGSAADTASQGTRSGGNSAESAGVLHSAQLSQHTDRTLEVDAARLKGANHAVADAIRRTQSGSPRASHSAVNFTERAQEAATIRQSLHRTDRNVAELDAHSKHTVALLRAWERATVQLSLRCTRAETEADRAHTALQHALRWPPAPLHPAVQPSTGPGQGALIDDVGIVSDTGCGRTGGGEVHGASTALPVITPLASEQTASESDMLWPAPSVSDGADVQEQAASLARLQQASEPMRGTASHRSRSLSPADEDVDATEAPPSLLLTPEEACELSPFSRSGAAEADAV